MSKENDVEGAINAVSNLAKAVPIYEDAIQPLAKQTGKALGTVGELVNAALLPVQGLVWGADQIKKWTQETLEKKLENKNPDDIVSPDLAIAGPTVEALKFRGHDAEISEMFANLLAHNMIKSSKSKVHPTFVEAIKELTPFEAKLFASCVDFGLIPVAGFSIKTQGTKGEHQAVFPFNEDVIQNAKFGRSADISEWQAAIENMERLGLLRLRTDQWYTDDRMIDWYKKAEEHPIAVNLRSQLPSQKTLVVKKGCLIVTQLGKNFSQIALASP